MDSSLTGYVSWLDPLQDIKVLSIGFKAPIKKMKHISKSNLVGGDVRDSSSEHCIDPEQWRVYRGLTFHYILHGQDYE